jgi:cyanophycin synthetase
VLMDYCHNVAGLEALGDFVTRIDATRRIGIIAMPGDRQDQDIAAFGKLAATLFDELIIREDTNTRGRQRGEVAGLLRSAAIDGGLQDDRITTVLDEVEAVREAMKRSSKDEFVVMMIDKPTVIWDELNNLNGVLTVI